MAASWRLISATETAAQVERALDHDDEPSAIRHLTETVSRLIQAPNSMEIPGEIVAAPAAVGDLQYATLIATAFAYAMELRGFEALPWMTDVEPLANEWLWDGDSSSSSAFRDLIRRETPAVFLAKNILTRERDWIAV